jgi:two-component system, OmpR family, sensor kinase
MPRPKLRSLAARLVMIGLLQLTLLAATAAGIFIAEGPPSPPVPFEVITSDVQSRLESLAQEPLELRRALEELQEKRVDVSIYDAELNLIASSAEPPLVIPNSRLQKFGNTLEGSLSAVRRKGPPLAVRDFLVNGSNGYLVAVGIPRKGITVAPVFVLVVGFSILVLGALLTARWIVKPIAQLSLMAREVGEGDFSKRSHFQRGDEIGDLGIHIDEMLERIQKLMASERELLANVAHELRTPLARIGVAIDLATEGNAEIARRSLAEISVDTAELVTMIDDIFLATRFDKNKGELPLNRALSQPDKICEDAVVRFSERHRDRALDIAFAENLPPIHVDPILFRRALDNLLENAHKYTPDALAPIAFNVTAEGSVLVFEIADQGLGIPKEDLRFLFEAFFRGDKSRTRETGGVGLGLALTKRIVEAHAGKIEVSSVVGRGSSFRVTIPIDPLQI